MSGEPLNGESTRSIERRFLGVAEVDSGTLLIGDPAYVLPRVSQGTPGVDYEDVVRAVTADQGAYALPLAGQPVVLVSNFGGDVPAAVFGEFEEGELIGIWINLSPPMDDDDDDEDDDAA